MAGDKNIRIGIGVTGADKAAADVAKVETATEQLTQSTEQLGEAAEDAGRDGAKLERSVSDIADVQKAQAVVNLGDQVAKLGARFAAVADEVEDLDPEAAKTLRNIGTGLDTVGSKVATVAAGFAAGGPIGGALAALGSLIQSITQLWAQNEMEALRAAASEQAALDDITAATREAKTAAEERAAVLANTGTLAALDAELSKAKELTSELQRQLNLVRERRDLEDEKLNQKDQADKEQINLDEASGKITPDEAAKRREEIDANARRRDRNERKSVAFENSTVAAIDALNKTKAAGTARRTANDLAAQRDKVSEQASALEAYVSGELGKMVPDPDTGELSQTDKDFVAEMEAEVTRAKNLLAQLDAATKKAEAAASKAEGEAGSARSNAKDKGEIAEFTATSLDEVQAEDDRAVGLRAKSRDATTRRAAEEKKRREDEREARQLRSAESRVGTDAVSLLPDNVREEFRDAVTRVSKGLKDGDQGGELRQLLSLMQSLAQAVGTKDQSLSAEISQLRAQINTLEQQSKNNRKG